ncbi:MAG: CheR family methyltransferase, partial [Bryobacteraceae bacterium]
MNERDARLSNADFNRLRALIYRESGISLNSDKKTMLEMRINPRLLDLGISSYAEYCDYVFTLQGRAEELVNLIDAATTNKTSFFREANHFNFLVAKALPEITARRSFRRNTLIWSAGCSTGEEAYTLAMVLSQYERNRPD